MKRLILIFFLALSNILFSQWGKFNTPVINPSDLFFKDSLSGLLIGDHFSSKTLDGGKSWYIPQQTQPSFLSAKLYFINNNIGFGYRYGILKTVDMGDSWENVTPEGYHAFFNMYFITDSIGYIVGDKGEIFVTRNQGSSWLDISYQKGDGIYLYSIYFSDTNNGWIYGNGFKLKTSDGGNSWLKENADYNIREIKFFDANFGYALIGGGYKILKTLNGGNNWEIITTPNSIAQGSIFFLSKDIGYISGGIANNNYLYGRIYKTTDGCKTWKPVYASKFSSVVGKMFFLDEKHGWAISTLGLLKTIKRGIITSVENLFTKSNVNDFNLFPNYPNPFNPSTTIEYNINKPSEVRLIIYDVLGREIKSIFNEFKDAGHYKVIFNGKDLPSGIYYYRLVTENNYQTKPMILLK